MDPDAQRELTAALNARRGGSKTAIKLHARDLGGLQAVAADLAGADLSCSRLEAGCLAGARLSRANLEGANLRDVDLGGADLTEANLKYADLTGARLDDAVLTGADLRGACLLDVLGDPLSLSGARVDKSAIERSEYRMRDIAQLVIRGADVDEKERLPPRGKGDPESSLGQSAPSPAKPFGSERDSSRSWLASIGPLLGSLRPASKSSKARQGEDASREPGAASWSSPTPGADSAGFGTPSTERLQAKTGSASLQSAGLPDIAAYGSLRASIDSKPTIADTPFSAGPPSAGPPSAGPPSAGPPSAGPPSAGPPSVDLSAGPSSHGLHENLGLGPLELRPLRAMLDVSPQSDGYSADSLEHARARVQASILPSLQARERQARKEQADLDEEIPASLRFFRAMNALITEARPSLEPQPSSRPAPPPPSADGPPTADAPPSGFRMPALGEQFLGVTLEQELPGGTTARSFRGTSADGEKVVVKVFDPDRAGAELQLAAFQRGTRALNRVQSLNTGRHLSVAELLAVSTDFLAYVVRDYENGSIANIVDVAITMKGGLEMFQTICESVAALHDQGVLVRAIKPSNILIDGLTPLIGEVDLVDLPTLTRLRTDGGGYASYIAPEERLGQGTRSPTADIFALGKLLEYLLTGHEPISPLGAPPLILDRKGTPPVLVDLVKRCIAPDPRDRYQYVEELLADLRKVQQLGAAATLQASIRPGALSRLKAGPSLAPKAPQQPKRRKVPTTISGTRAVPEVHATKEKWLSRRAELGVAGFGLLLGAAGSLIFYFAPRGVEAMETAEIALACGAGLSIWLLPRPSRRIAVQRLGAWSALAALIYLLDPVQISVLRWRRDLAAGDAAARENAVARLTRLGFRDLSNQNLSGLSLNQIDLGNVSFRGSDLTGTDLSYSFLGEADFSGADLAEARLFGANLREAALGDAKNVRSAACNERTKFSPGADCSRGTIRVTPAAPRQ